MGRLKQSSLVGVGELSVVTLKSLWQGCFEVRQMSPCVNGIYLRLDITCNIFMSNANEFAVGQTKGDGIYGGAGCSRKIYSSQLLSSVGARYSIARMLILAWKGTL